MIQQSDIKKVEVIEDMRDTMILNTLAEDDARATSRRC